jgi:hypothetical protein
MKIYDFDADEYGPKAEVHRFFCNCGSINHVLEITKEPGLTQIGYYSGGTCCRTLWQRIKMAIALVFRLENKLTWSEFCVREEDKIEIAKLLWS